MKALVQKLKNNLPALFFIFFIPLGILLGYFFSNVKNFVGGGYKDIKTSYNKIFYVAKVDGVGIPKSEWKNFLKSRYGSLAVNDLINRYMVENELKKADIQVSDEEINKEIAKIEKDLNGQSLEELLKQQGMTLKDFRREMYIQVGVRKLLRDRVSVSDDEVKDYVNNYGSSLSGSTDEEKFAEAKDILINNKIDQEEAFKWFRDLQARVKVENYME